MRIARSAGSIAAAVVSATVLGLFVACNTTFAPELLFDISVSVASGGGWGSGLVTNLTDVPDADPSFGIRCAIKPTPGFPGVCYSGFQDADGRGKVVLSVSPGTGSLIEALGGDCAESAGDTCTLNFTPDERSVEAVVYFDRIAPSPASISLDTETASISVGEDLTITATVLDHRGDFMTVDVSWFDLSVGVVDLQESGLSVIVTGLSPGVATIEGAINTLDRTIGCCVPSTAEATVTVTASPGPQVTISSPQPLDEYVVYDLVTFTGSADDIEDGADCCQSSFSWTDELAGQTIGTATSFSSDSFVVGEQLVRLTVEDSDGNQGSQAVDFTVRLGGLVIFQSPSDQVVTTDGLDQSYLIDGERPVLSPDGSQIAYTFDVGGDDEIWVADADGQNPVQVTDNGVDDDDATWSPDGTRIAFTSSRAGSEDIWIMDADRGNPVRITTDPGEDNAPAWRGDVLLFQRESSGDKDIYSVPVDLSTAPTPLTANLVDDERPRWTPDGRILFSSWRDGNSEIYIMDADGSNPTRLTNDPAEDEHADMSPDGTKIVFTSDRRGGVSDLFVMKADGSKPVHLRFIGGSYPRWRQ